MEKHPCLGCERMPRGQNMEVEPCASCQEPDNYCNRIGPAGIGSVPYKISDYQPRKEPPMDTTPSPPGPAREADPTRIDMFTCKACETPKPRTAEHFAQHARTTDGLHTTCRECMGKLIGKGHKNRKKKPTTERKAGPTPPGTRPPKTERKRVRRDLNFYDHEDLMKAIEKDAAAQFRKFNSHVLFILQQHVDQLKTRSLQ